MPRGHPGLCVYTIFDLEGVVRYVGKGGGRRDKWWKRRNASITALIRSGQTKRPVRVAVRMADPAEREKAVATLAAARRGQKHSDEAKAKISAARRAHLSAVNMATS
jgi:NUMOD3 motif